MTFCGLNYVNPKVGSTICNQLGYGGNSCKCCYKYMHTSQASKRVKVALILAQQSRKMMSFFPSVVGTLIYDGRFGDGETVQYSRRIYCRNEYNSIQYCSITVANNAGSCISSLSPLECSYNRLGLRCYSMLI